MHRDNAIKNVLEKQNFIQGDEVKAIESMLSEYTSTKALSVANGTDALFIALKALGVKAGDEVITPAFTWVSTVEVIKLLNAKPVFIDISEDTFNLNESLINELINEKTKVILPVSLFGRCPRLDRIKKISESNNIAMLEDAAQSFGAKSNSNISCSVSDIATTSFFPSKPLGCYGDGGCIFTKNKKLFDEVSMISKHGQRSRYDYQRVGVNSRLDTLQAAILIEKFKVFENEIKLRNEVAKTYNKKLKNIDGLKCPIIPDENNRSVWAQYTVLLSKELSTKRDLIMDKLKSLGIPSALYYPALLHKQEPYLDDSFLPVSEDVASRVLSLPMYPYLTKDDIEYISENLQIVIESL